MSMSLCAASCTMQQKSQMSTVDARQQMERTTARATPAEDVNELTNLPTDHIEIHVHTTRQNIQDRCVYGFINVIHMFPLCRDEIKA